MGWTFTGNLVLLGLAPLVGHAMRRLTGVLISDGQTEHNHHPVRNDPIMAIPAMELFAMLPPIWLITLGFGGNVLAGCVIGWAVLWLAVCDIHYLLLPNMVTLALAVIGLVLRAGTSLQSFYDGFIGALVGFALFLLLAVGYRWLRRRHGLGLGDVKLLAAGGAVTGWQGLASIVAIGAVLTVVTVAIWRGVTRRPFNTHQPLPFGAGLAVGIWLTWLYGPVADWFL